MKVKYIANGPNELVTWLERTLGDSEFSIAMIGGQVKLYIRLPNWGQQYEGIFYTFKGDVAKVTMALEQVNDKEETVILDLKNNEEEKTSRE